MRNLFEVGEEVILITRDVEVVIVCLDNKGNFICEGCGKNQQKYWIDLFQKENGVCQCGLRKKQEPGGSFESIMDSLKQPIKQPVLVTDTQQGDNHE